MSILLKEHAEWARLDPFVMKWVSAFASCAIEGNKSAKRMIDMWNNGDVEQFLFELYRDWVE